MFKKLNDDLFVNDSCEDMKTFPAATLTDAVIGALLRSNAPEAFDGMHLAEIESSVRSAIQAVGMDPDEHVNVFPAGRGRAYVDAYHNCLASLGYNFGDHVWYDSHFSAEEIEEMHDEWEREYGEGKHEADYEEALALSSEGISINARPRWTLVQDYALTHISPEAREFALNHDEACYQASVSACRICGLDPDDPIEPRDDGSITHDDIFAPSNEEEVLTQFRHYMQFFHGSLYLSTREGLKKEGADNV